MSVLLKLLFIIFVNFTNGEFVSSDNDANLIPNIIGEDSVDQMSSSNESSYLDNLGLDRNETIHISITNPNIIIDENYCKKLLLVCYLLVKCLIFSQLQHFGMYN